MIRQPSCVIAIAGFVPQGSTPGKERSFATRAGTGTETFGLPPGASVPNALAVSTCHGVGERVAFAMGGGDQALTLAPPTSDHFMRSTE